MKAATGFLPCRGGPFDGKQYRAGDVDAEVVPLTIPTGQTTVICDPDGQHETVDLVIRGRYVRVKDVYVWEDLL